MTDKNCRENGLPIGTHVVSVPPNVVSYLEALKAGQNPLLDGTRIWLRRDKEKLVLHLGDVDVSQLGQ
jgi:hypothetical protein